VMHIRRVASEVGKCRADGNLENLKGHEKVKKPNWGRGVSKVFRRGGKEKKGPRGQGQGAGGVRSWERINVRSTEGGGGKSQSSRVKCQSVREGKTRDNGATGVTGTE